MIEAGFIEFLSIIRTHKKIHAGCYAQHGFFFLCRMKSNPLERCAASVLCDAFNKPFFKVVNEWLPVLEGFIIQAII